MKTYVNDYLKDFNRITRISILFILTVILLGAAALLIGVTSSVIIGQSLTFAY